MQAEKEHVALVSIAASAALTRISASGCSPFSSASARNGDPAANAPSVRSTT